MRPTRIELINVKSDKCRHSQVDKKSHSMLYKTSAISRHWDRNTSSDTHELW